MRITKRDQHILHDLINHKYLSTTQITRLHFTSENKARGRLAILRQNKLISFFEKPKTSVRGKGEYYHYITKKGAETILDSTKSFTPAKPIQNLQKVGHHSRLNDFWINLRQACNENTNISFQLIPEFKTILEEGKPQKVIQDETPHPETLAQIAFIPDAVFYLQKDSTKLLFFLEIDLGTEPLNTIKEKMLTYCSYFDNEGYKRYNKIFKHHFKGYRLLITTETIKRIESIQQILKDYQNVEFVWMAEHKKVTNMFEKIWGNSMEDELAIVD